jgi:hypothetical protein
MSKSIFTPDEKRGIPSPQIPIQHPVQGPKPGSGPVAPGSPVQHPASPGNTPKK